VETASGGATAEIVSGGGTSSLFMGDPSDRDSGSITYANASDSMQFVTNASERMRITSAGDVGISTTSPTKKISASIGLNDTDGLALEYNGENRGGILLNPIGGEVRMGAQNSTGTYFTTLYSNGSERVRVDASGLVGIGATTVDRQLHIEGSRSNAYSSTDFDNTYNLIKIENPNTANNMATGIQFLVGSNGSAAISATRTGDGAASLCFGTRGGGSRAERMRITDGGVVLVGTTDTSPFNNTSGTGTSLSGGDIQIASSSSESLYLNRIGSDGRVVSIRKGGSFIGGINVSTSQVTYNQTSDYRLKENVSYTWDATTRLKQLKPARFNYIVDPDNIVDGFLAHEVSEACPSAITGEKDAVDSDGNIDPQCIDHSKLVPLLVKTIQELEARLTDTETRLTALENAE
jgi:hypothetical protein